MPRVNNTLNTHKKQIEDFNDKEKIKNKTKPSFKKSNWTSKFRMKDKTVRAAKNIKNLMQDSNDNLSYNLCKIL